MTKSNFRLLMLSAGFEHGGNVTHRYFDGHEELFVYPFESQLGNRYSNDFLASIERQQYRYPEFPGGLSSREYYELFFDEELKTLLRKPAGSKFKDADLEMNEEDRIQSFCRFMEDKAPTRANLVEGFFRSTFEAWKNYKVSGKNNVYVGYSPAIGLDADKILHDFPDAHVLHVVRNPHSAYSDTKKRPFPLSIRRYSLTWNIYHSTVLAHAKMFPQNITILKYEDLIENTEQTLRAVCDRVGISFQKTMLYPSWNGEDISKNIYPWGTIAKSTPEYNMKVANELTKEEKEYINRYTETVRVAFEYSDL